MKLGIIVLPDGTEEMNAAIAALRGIEGVEIQTTDATTSDDLDDLGGNDDLDGFDEPAELHVPTADELKLRLTEVRDEKGVDMLKEILTSFGATNLKTLTQDDWPAAYAAAGEVLGAGGAEDDMGFDDLDDLGGDDLDATDAPDADTVKALCQKYAAKNGKEKAAKILKDAGLNTVRGLAKSTDEQRAKIYAQVKCME